MIAGGTAPDVVRMNDTTPIELGLQGHLMPIEPLAAKDPDIDIDKYFPGARSAMSWNNVLFGLPLGVSLYLPLVNVDLFNSYGVPIPDESWTWDRERVVGIH